MDPFLKVLPVLYCFSIRILRCYLIIMVSIITSIAQNDIIGFRGVKTNLYQPSSIFLQKKMSFFPTENRNVLIFSGFETQKIGTIPIKLGRLAGMPQLNLDTVGFLKIQLNPDNSNKPSREIKCPKIRK